MQENKYPLLDRINSPADLRAMDEKDMPALAEEIRAFLVEHVTQTGGHLASNLGVVELSIALHRVFDSPHDHIIFDVGHQSYVHKLLTGRREEFSTLRRPGGLSGFTRRSESRHDPFGAGHSSTSVSAAVGFAQADKLSGSDAFSVAVVGDGAFTGGMIHEALNNVKSDLRLIVILNENEMSIGRNIGGFARHIAKIRSSPNYLRTKSQTGRFLARLPLIGPPLYAALRDTKKFFKNLLFSSNYFEDLGLFYLGPAGGNNYHTVEHLLRTAKNKGECVLLHLKTVKGKGYPPAEKHPAEYHGIPPAGAVIPRNYSKEMGSVLLGMAQRDARICAVTAAMASSTGLSGIAKMLPERFFDVGIAEEHAVTFCAGLAAEGKKPFFAVYSSFLQRAYDGVLHDIALQKLPVTLCIDRAGLSSGDGPTHHGVFDVSLISGIPDFELFAPSSFASLASALEYAAHSDAPCAIRYPNAGEDPAILRAFFDKSNPATPLLPRADFSRPDKLRAIIITYGRIASEALRAEEELNAEGIATGVILLEKLKPYGDTAEALLRYLPDRDCILLFLEEGIRYGGAGMLLFDELTRRYPSALRNKKTSILAIDDSFVWGCRGETLYSTAGISAKHAADEIKRLSGIE